MTSHVSRLIVYRQIHKWPLEMLPRLIEQSHYITPNALELQYTLGRIDSVSKHVPLEVFIEQPLTLGLTYSDQKAWGQSRDRLMTTFSFKSCLCISPSMMKLDEDEPSTSQLLVVITIVGEFGTVVTPPPTGPLKNSMKIVNFQLEICQLNWNDLCRIVYTHIILTTSTNSPINYVFHGNILKTQHLQQSLPTLCLTGIFRHSSSPWVQRRR